MSPGVSWSLFTPSSPSLGEKDKLWAMRSALLLIFLSLIAVGAQLLGKSAPRWRLFRHWGLGLMAHLPFGVSVNGLLAKPVVRREAELPRTSRSAEAFCLRLGDRPESWVGWGWALLLWAKGPLWPRAPWSSFLPLAFSHLSQFLPCSILRGSSSVVCALSFHFTAFLTPD